MRKRGVCLVLLLLVLTSSVVAQGLLGFGCFSTGLDDGVKTDWSLEITSRNSLIITYTRGGEMSALGPFTMSEEESREIWDLVHEARFDRRDETGGIREFQEVLFTFITVDEEERRSFLLWRSDVRHDRRLRRLTEGIEELISQYAPALPELL